jgi:thiol:disulfide interchange protein DsbA
MPSGRLAWILVLSVALGACGGKPSDTPPATTLTPPSTALTPPATPATPAPTSKATRLNEDGSESSDQPSGDSSTHSALLTAVAATLAAGTSKATAAAVTDPPTLWQEGVNYTRLVPAQPTDVAPGQVEVLEFFWYGCPHCYALDPAIEAWRKTKAPYIAFSRVPVMWSESHRSTARLFYTLKLLGKLDQMHGEVFKEIHVNGDPLVTNDPNDTAGAERLQSAFVGKFGISAESFSKAYRSFPVETDLQRADELGLRYRIDAVPTFVVNGKYVADVRTAGSPERLISMIDDLAAQEHRH